MFGRAALRRGALGDAASTGEAATRTAALAEIGPWAVRAAARHVRFRSFAASSRGERGREETAVDRLI
ncbi:hypothetical protein WT60_00335 [Burkholderia sp. MSMB617WGS]|uniref:Uncharacterized protein n=1 Tax=Burkholderia savannae TaxID=1637837 RepID=A0ABR5TD63_9BURK|nr:hypothetical protein WS78_18365 [Burkholderia savannae]AOK45473.1 hypothetical protein WT60_00335 [Burkholderia sp. MSMB617WGS]KVG47444.1 hypothetical protein WS77_04660 [Burkholderia sp. MSMB0265]KVG82396.1 hypothetical protein WS81_01225 [Burkholderia sp. MSMB2040]KVG92639.1 hypothetical protein WS82_10510 [Burkholderia sp. MSMB2041]KVG98498.1 hypothetical protein WS83_28305 [Burkholderia sp. MSMB2042]KVK76995.1 hypothetical protein WS91_00860 [Burkholderia sp. MSMB1498]